VGREREPVTLASRQRQGVGAKQLSKTERNLLLLGARELVKQIRHSVDHWPLVIFTEDRKIEHLQEPSPVKQGSRITVNWPVCACSKLDQAKLSVSAF
jgi:hypothetical protein